MRSDGICFASISFIHHLGEALRRAAAAAAAVSSRDSSSRLLLQQQMNRWLQDGLNVTRKMPNLGGPQEGLQGSTGGPEENNTMCWKVKQ